MIAKERWFVAAAIGLPVMTITAYLLWIWPRPHGTSLVASVGPYVFSLMTGVPFVWRLGRGRGRAWLLLAFLAVGFVVMWFYAAVILCGVRGVCL